MPLSVRLIQAVVKAAEFGGYIFHDAGSKEIPVATQTSGTGLCASVPQIPVD